MSVCAPSLLSPLLPPVKTRSVTGGKLAGRVIELAGGNQTGRVPIGQANMGACEQEQVLLLLSGAFTCVESVPMN